MAFSGETQGLQSFKNHIEKFDDLFNKIIALASPEIKEREAAENTSEECNFDQTMGGVRKKG